MLNENGDKVDSKRDILAEIAERTIKRINAKKLEVPLDEIKEKALKMKSDDFLFEKALKEEQTSFICEVKKASPSKGIIAQKFPYLDIAKDYEKSGATAISCLTEPFYFMGDDKYLEEITQNVKIPVLRKDFFVDEYMIYEAKLLGASAILLICSILTDEQLQKFYDIANELGLSAIFEVHDEEETKRALKCSPKIIGVNNRNLKTFEVDLNNSVNLRKLVTNEVIFISESGIKTPDDIKLLRENNVDGVLIGETFMKSENIYEKLQKLRG